jgi:hypothetical protein
MYPSISRQATTHSASDTTLSCCLRQLAYLLLAPPKFLLPAPFQVRLLRLFHCTMAAACLLLPDFTYTGYQPPCTVTTSGRVETIFPIVPASDSSLFYGGGVSGTTPADGSVPTAPTAAESSLFASGIFAQALQCGTPVTPTTTSFAVSSITTVISVVDCFTIESIHQPGANRNGVCHTSGYRVYNVFRRGRKSQRVLSRRLDNDPLTLRGLLLYIGDRGANG